MTYTACPICKVNYHGDDGCTTDGCPLNVSMFHGDEVRTYTAPREDVDLRKDPYEM